MHFKSAAAEAHAVRGQILAEVRHPATEAEADEICSYNAFVPFKGFRHRQVYHAAVVLAEIEEIVAAVRPFNEIALLAGLGKQYAALDEVGIYITHPARIFIRRNDLVQSGI